MSLEAFAQTPFTVVDVATGKVLRTGSCPALVLTLQPKEGEMVIEGLAEPGKRWDDAISQWVDLPPILPNYGRARADRKRRIDAHAELIRNRFLTPGSAMAMVYMQKQAEALAYQANPAEGSFPLLQPEAAVFKRTLAQQATIVLGQAEAWKVKAGQLEALRLAAKMAVDSAPDDLGAIETAGQAVFDADF
jgi:hypothetical protein